MGGKRMITGVNAEFGIQHSAFSIRH